MDRPTQPGGTPTEWNDLPTLIDHIRHLVQHGDDPTPLLPALGALAGKAGPELRRISDDFGARVGRYLQACVTGAPEVEDRKHDVESFRDHRFVQAA